MVVGNGSEPRARGSQCSDREGVPGHPTVHIPSLDAVLAGDGQSLVVKDRVDPCYRPAADQGQCAAGCAAQSQYKLQQIRLETDVPWSRRDVDQRSVDVEEVRPVEARCRWLAYSQSRPFSGCFHSAR